MTERIVIVGGGHAAAQLCSLLADAGEGARVDVVCEEPSHPYHRPPLSKAYLKSRDESHQLHRDAGWYAEKGVQVHLGDSAVGIDRAAREVRLASGRVLPYGRLVLATGTRARRLPQLPPEASNLAVLRTLADAQGLREKLLARQGALTVVGGGFIGLEVASTARHLGWSVTVLEAAPRLLSRSASPRLAQHVLEHHRAAGTDVRLGVSIGQAQAAGGRVVSLDVAGAALELDELLVGVGAVPEVSLAEAAGLLVENGIVVDGHMVTSDPAVLAIGDCSSFEYAGARVRLESVQNANDQARAAAATLLGKPSAYQPVPFFWSDQGGLKLQMAGLWRQDLEGVERRGTTPASFSVFHYAGDRLACVESANAPMDHILARRFLDKGVSPAREQVADPAVPLKSLLPG